LNLAEVGLDDADPDVRLMLALRGGDGSALEALFERWAGRLLRYLERLVRDSATAEELVQEAFLRVYRARDRYVPDSRFSTWLYRIGTNLALNELRRPSRRSPHASSDDEAAPLVLVAPGAGVDDLVDARRLAQQTSRELSRLPERQRMALWLSAVEGLSYAEIAEALETTDKSVKSLVHRARVTLVQRLPARHPAADAAGQPAAPGAGSAVRRDGGGRCHV
jgi:RNA polymerase sigma-70 factor (ECF subfamily)